MVGTRQAVVADIKAYEGGWDAMAGALAMSRTALENRVYEKKGQGLLVETALLIQEFSKTTNFAESVAQQSGGVFFRLPDPDVADNESITRKFNEVYGAIGELAADFNTFTADNEVTESERDVLNDVVRKIHARIEELLACTLRVYCRHNPDDRAGTQLRKVGSD